MSCVVCSKPTKNTAKCFKCKRPFCTSCLKHRKNNRCPGCQGAPKAAGGGGGGGGNWGSSDFDTALFGGSDGFGYLFPDALPDIPFRVIGSRDGFSGWMPKVKKIMGSIQQNFNPNDIDDVSDLDDEYQTIAREAQCHGDIKQPGTCPNCGLRVWFPNWDGGNQHDKAAEAEAAAAEAAAAAAAPPPAARPTPTPSGGGGGAAPPKKSGGALKFPNWKLGEKKTIKAKISEYENTVRQIDAKLGGGWDIEVDFGEFGSNTQSASSSYRKDPGRYIIQSIFTAFYSNDLSRMDQMSIDTVNNLVGNAKRLVYSCGPRSGSYQISNRLNISVDKTNGVKLTWNGDYFGYEHKENYFANWVDAQPGAVANAPFPGSWTAQQLKSIQSKQGTIDSAKNQIKSKFGSDWDVQVDWEQFANNTKSASSSYQKDVGRYIVEEIFMALASNDISRFTQDSVDGLNAHCAHKLKLTCGPRSSSYSISNRVNISADTTNGLVLQWNGDYFGYAWKEQYLFTWVDEQPSFAADPPYPGNWRLKDLKSLTQKKNYLETALSQLQAKCGAEWTFNVDWASICQNTQSGSSSYRNDYGRYVMDEIFSKWASCDLSLWDEDVAEAFNELAGDQHVITWKFGPRSGSYQISNRVNISIDESNGAVFEWNGDYFGYAWKEGYANKYILDNA